MSGQTDLKQILNSLKITCDGIEYGFSTVKKEYMEYSSKVFALIRENEGLTVIASKEYFDSEKINYEGPYAKLTIEVHTSLDLTGLTAVLSSKLAENKISANVIAGYFHDHIFVQHHLRYEAIRILNSLKNI